MLRMDTMYVARIAGAGFGGHVSRVCWLRARVNAVVEISGLWACWLSKFLWNEVFTSTRGKRRSTQSETLPGLGRPCEAERGIGTKQRSLEGAAKA